MKLESGMPPGGMAGSRGGEEGERPFLGFRVLGALSFLFGCLNHKPAHTSYARCVPSQSRCCLDPGPGVAPKLKSLESLG